MKFIKIFNEEIKSNLGDLGDLRIGYNGFALLPYQIDTFDLDISNITNRETRWLEKIIVLEQYKYIYIPPELQRQAGANSIALYPYLEWVPIKFLTKEEYAVFKNPVNQPHDYDVIFNNIITDLKYRQSHINKPPPSPPKISYL